MINITRFEHYLFFTSKKLPIFHQIIILIEKDHFKIYLCLFHIWS